MRLDDAVHGPTTRGLDLRFEPYDHDVDLAVVLERRLAELPVVVDHVDVGIAPGRPGTVLITSTRSLSDCEVRAVLAELGCVGHWHHLRALLDLPERAA